MAEPDSNSSPTWHPFTPKGVAGAAAAPRWQLWLALGFTALLSVSSSLFFFSHGWSPVITEAIDHLADGGIIRRGILHPGNQKTDEVLASNRHLAIALDWTGASARDQVSDVRVVLQIDRLLVCSLLGCVPVSYTQLGDMPVGRTETGAWWRTWQPYLYTIVAFGQVLFLVFSWWVLGIVYAWAIRFFAFYLDRDVDFAGATRVAQAALIPGALWLTATVYLHAQGWINLFGLIIVFVMHLPVGWLFAGLACRSLPKRADVLPRNPFQPELGDSPTSPAESSKNPFRSTGGPDR